MQTMHTGGQLLKMLESFRCAYHLCIACSSCTDVQYICNQWSHALQATRGSGRSRKLHSVCYKLVKLLLVAAGNGLLAYFHLYCPAGTDPASSSGSCRPQIDHRCTSALFHQQRGNKQATTSAAAACYSAGQGMAVSCVVAVRSNACRPHSGAIYPNSKEHGDLTLPSTHWSC